MILVTGASGNVGRNIVDELLTAGERVRAIARDPSKCDLPGEAEVVPADLSRPETLQRALRGVERLYLWPAFGELQGAVDAAVRAGVQHVVLLSSEAVTYAAGEPHIACEKAVAESGMSWTFLRPSAFMSNDLLWIPQIAKDGVVHGVYGSSAMVPIHERDIAAVAVKSLLSAKSGAIHSITGPQSLSQVERVRMLGAALGIETRFQEVPRERVRAQMVLYIPGSVADQVLDMKASLQGVVGQPLPTVETVVGRPPYTYAEWIAHHEAEFRPVLQL
ncbi:NAD(P)H-binding protein [Streptomyces sp. NPDC020719]|uniref:NAD(P)H-binding protein n=1 Tax=unclassified Streptomyces TaxID=2593676 RepID=UPI0033DF6846